MTDEKHTTNKDTLSALESLLKRWRAMAKKSRETSRKGGLGDRPPSYFDGVSTGLERALSDVRAIIEQDTVADEDSGNSEGAESYFAADTDYAENVLRRAGLGFNRLYHDNEHVFTVVFPRLLPMPLDERIDKLQAAADNIVILEHGKLENAPYIDFAFTQPSEDQ